MRDAAVTSVELYCKDHHAVCYDPCSLGLDFRAQSEHVFGYLRARDPA